MSLELRAALVGDYDKEVAQARERVAYAAYWGLDDYAAAFQSKLRQDLASSRLARGGDLSKTWRRRMYRNQGLNPAALVYSTMPAVVSAFEEGATITVQDGKQGSLFPNPDVWGRRLRRPSGRGAKQTSTFAMGVRRFGALQFIPTPGNGKQVGVYVAKLDRGHRAQGRFRKAGVRALRTGTFDRVVVFFVLKEPRLPLLLKGKVIRARAARDFPTGYQRAFDRRLVESERGPALLTFGGAA